MHDTSNTVRSSVTGVLLVRGSAIRIRILSRSTILLYLHAHTQPILGSTTMSRLASLTPSRARSSPSPSPSPSTPQITETTHHRMLKLLIQELRNVFKTWDELVLIDGMKAAKGCIDEMTEME